ncbi:MAG: hypothetical protein AAB602_00760 [Patescibacteria group bacterium]
MIFASVLPEPVSARVRSKAARRVLPSEKAHEPHDKGPLPYCYSDQNVEALKRYWSKITGIPQSRFSKPYVRTDFRKDGRKMKHGLIHIRYGDKKLLLEILRLIEYYQLKYASVV